MIHRDTPNRRRPFLSQGKTLPIRIHSENDSQKYTYYLSPIKLKTQASKVIQSSRNIGPRRAPIDHQGVLTTAKRLFSERKFDEAIFWFKQLLESDDTEALYFLGCSFMHKQKYEHCIYYLNLQLEKDPVLNKNSFLMVAIAYKELKLFKAAIKVLDKGIETFKIFEEASIYMAKIHMQMNEHTKALEILSSLVETSPSPLCILSYADCLRLNSRLGESLQYYQAILQQDDLRPVVLLKRMTAYFELKEYQKSLQDCCDLIQNHRIETSEVYYFKGMNQLALHPGEDFPIEFDRALDLNTHQLAVTKALCEIVTNHITKKDIYAAEAEIRRIPFLNIRDREIDCLRCFVQGAVDCVKKRSNEAIPKLLQVQKALRSKKYSYSGVLLPVINMYLGYAYFLSSEYSRAIKCYQVDSRQSKATHYNKLLCEGISCHKSKEYAKCTLKLTIAKNLIPHFEPYFYLGINFMQQFFINNQTQFLEKAVTELEAGMEFNPPSIYFFYLTLVLVYAKKPADQMINLAIEKSDDNVADYYFVRGIIEAQNDLTIALNDFTSAIEALKIPAYFKERSKCLYQLGHYASAIEDLLKISSEQDYEAILLLSFNYYSNEQYELSLRNLEEKCMGQENQYIQGVITTLHIRLNNYRLAGPIGEVLFATGKGIKVADQDVWTKFQQIIAEREPVGEFQCLDMLCLEGCHNFVCGDYDKALTSFYSVLSLVKQQLSNDGTIDFGTEAKIYQSKFNIALIHIMLREYSECCKLLEVLVDETEASETVEALGTLLKLVKEQADPDIKMKIDPREERMGIFEQFKLLSESFPSTRQRFKSVILTIRPILFYPEKMKFNIFPELNPRFLKDFGIRKVENSPEPPWVVRDGNSFNFTHNIDTGGAQIEASETAGDARSSVDSSKVDNSNRQLTTEELKLSDDVQQKISRIIRKTKPDP